MNQYIAFLCEKLNITDSEFAEIMAAPPRQHMDFKTVERQRAFFRKIKHGILDILKIER